MARYGCRRGIAAIASVGKPGGQVDVLHNNPPAAELRAGRNRTSGEIEMQGAYHVNALGRLK